MDMILQYIKLALRSFTRNLTISIGSMATLLLGTVCIALLFSYVYNELSMDRFHKHENDIYAMVIRTNDQSQWKVIEADLFFDFDYKDYPELEILTSIKKYPEGDVKLVSEKSVYTPEGIVADSTFFEVFDFNLIRGDRKTVLRDPDAILLTAKFAEKVFGKDNPIGKEVLIKGRVEKSYTVKGILENPPSNSSIIFDFILPDYAEKYNRMGANYILAKPGFDKNAFVDKIRDIGHKHEQFTNTEMDIIPFNDLYFLRNISNMAISGVSRTGDKQSLYVLIVMMFVILVISALNFSNLQVIGVNASVKQAAIYTVYGAQTRNLIGQKITEVVLLTFFSGVLAVGLYQSVLPAFNRFTGVALNPPFWDIVYINSAILLVLAILALLYPLTALLKLSLAKSLKDQFAGNHHLLGRKVVIVAQYTLTFVLLIGAIVVASQLNLMLRKDLGFHPERIIETKLLYDLPYYNVSKEEREKAREAQKGNHLYVKNELASHTSVLNFTQGMSILDVYQMDWKPETDHSEFTTQNILSLTPGYEKTHGLELVEGRFFDKERDEQRSKKVVINEAAKEYWQIDDVTTNSLRSKSWSGKYEIIGVVRDFNYQHLSIKPQPLVMLYFDDPERDFIIKFREGQAESGIAFVKELFDKLNPDENFQYTFLTDTIADQYQKEKRLSVVYILFTIVALLISATGLFAIALYDTQRRVKEIGIRKVNGAKVKEVLLLLNRDFMKWVFVAFVISCPIAYYILSKWLENFAYKTELSWWIFALAGFITLLIALLTVSGLSYRAAVQNPVDVLKDE